ncbi:Eukaryotic translation initiation factor 3 subunit K [Saguinus oedipus]|uniref:Eukaryotic translation initiation factor 3 subunit K n=1 Tax=Saguinus oedipus TaxID=9490 RepID=A0ABQ9UVD2_SAGOE|nr:Eukaryotic translation initiation factor 3 subunit K [Saguinus oedipus]
MTVVMAMFEQMRANVGKLLKGIDRYNPENLATLERYVETQAKENAYDLEANLAVLKLYQFNPAFFQTTVTAQILLKALTNLPHTDFTLRKCRIDQARQEERPIRQILYLGDLLETCHFQTFWQALDENMDLLEGITGFEDSVRKFICHVVGITYQQIDRWLLAEMLGDLSDSQLKVWMSKYGWSADELGQIFICSQEESIKPKNIVEKIDFDSVSSIMASSHALGRLAALGSRVIAVAVCEPVARLCGIRTLKIATMAENGDNEKMAALGAKICHQTENLNYFGDFNLPRDKFLKEQIKLDEGWVPLEIMIKFNRLNRLTTDFNVIVEALSKSKAELMEISEDKTKIRSLQANHYPK